MPGNMVECGFRVAAIFAVIFVKGNAPFLIYFFLDIVEEGEVGDHNEWGNNEQHEGGVVEDHSVVEYEVFDGDVEGNYLNSSPTPFWPPFYIA